MVLALQRVEVSFNVQLFKCYHRRNVLENLHDNNLFIYIYTDKDFAYKSFEI